MKILKKYKYRYKTIIYVKNFTNHISIVILFLVKNWATSCIRPYLQIYILKLHVDKFSA